MDAEHVPQRMSRRRFLELAAAGSALVIGVGAGVVPELAEGALPLLGSTPQVAKTFDLGDFLIAAAKPTADLLVLTVGQDGVARLLLPREEVGQGITTSMAMIVADELELPLAKVEVVLEDARPDLVWNQITGGSNTTRSLWDPLRRAAAAARERMKAAAAERFGVPRGVLTVADGVVRAPDGRTATYGQLAPAAAQERFARLVAQPKPLDQLHLVGTPTSRRDARAMVTGQQRYTLDHQVPGAKPAMVRRPPRLHAPVVAIRNADAVRARPGVLFVGAIPTGVAVVGETFGQVLDAVAALDVEWGPGPLDGESDATVEQRLVAAVPPLAPSPPGAQTVEATFDWAAASHAPLEPNAAIADVRADRADVWTAAKTPIVAQQSVADAVGLPQDAVHLHVVQGGGSFGRRLFFDAPVEAAQISQAAGRPVKLLWPRVDDMRHGRAHPQVHSVVRASVLGGQVVAFQHHVACVETDFRHGLGEMLSANAAILPPASLGNTGYSETVFQLTVVTPYAFGAVEHQLAEVALPFPTGSFRSVYSYSTRGAEEVVVDELAALLGQDPVAFRRANVEDARHRAVIDEAAKRGGWGRALPAGVAQGFGFHAEYRSCTACLVELDGRDAEHPRVTRATVVVDAGIPVNPRGLQAQMLGGLTDAISLVLKAGLHVVDGLPLEGSYSQFHYARQADAPLQAEVHVMPRTTTSPGGAGELGLPAAVGAVANAWARATGRRPRRFPVLHPVGGPVDFVPFPPGQVALPPDRPLPR